MHSIYWKLQPDIIIILYILVLWSIPFFVFFKFICILPPGVHKAVCSPEPNPGVFEAWFLENCLQPRTLRHPEPALQSADPAGLAFPFCVFSNFTGKEAPRGLRTFEYMHANRYAPSDAVVLLARLSH